MLWAYDWIADFSRTALQGPSLAPAIYDGGPSDLTTIPLRLLGARFQLADLLFI